MKTNSELKSEINRKDANEIELLKYIGELEHELRTCKKILLEANELLRSAYAIAQRNGEQTNWEAFRTQLQKALQAQHESGLTQRVPDAGVSAASQTLSPQSGESTPEVYPAATQRR